MASWRLQQINNSGNPSIPGEFAATNGPPAIGGLFVSVYNNQQHFAYIDGNYNIQDAWYDGDRNQWSLQQINNANGAPSIPGEYVATNGPAARSPWLVVFVSTYNNQQHFSYVDANDNIQDAWYDGDANGWRLQQINNAKGAGPTIPVEDIATNGPASGINLFVTVYNDQQHFTYAYNGNIQDAWYDGAAGAWNLQQINNPTGEPAIPGEFVATNGPLAMGTALTGHLFVSVYNNQQHFTYRDTHGNVQDAWYDGDANQWRLQQINNPNNSPAIPGEYIATNGPGSFGAGPVFVSIYNNQQHFVYVDVNSNIQDAWYDGSANTWNLQQINNPSGPSLPGEYIATNGPALGALDGGAFALGNLFVSVYNNQQHFTYVDVNRNIQDAWYDGDANRWHLQQINNSASPTVPGEFAATNGPPAFDNLFVSIYNNQHHFTYLDSSGNIQDAWYG